MRYYFSKFLLVAVLTMMIPAIAALGQAGFLDPSFGGTGMIQFGIGGAQESGQATAVQSDGLLLVAGIRQDVGQIVVLRLGTNNLPDPSFGSGGLAAFTPPVEAFNVSGVAEQPDGKIVVAGTVVGTGSDNYDFMLARFNPDGSVDSSFGNGGFASRDVSGASSDTCTAMVLQPDGKIVLVGSTAVNPGAFNQADYLSLARFDTNGNADFPFGSGGVVLPTNSFNAWALALEGDGKILVGGYMSGNGVIRFTTNGILDASFGSGGKVIIPPALSITAVAIQPAGIQVSQPEMILAAGPGTAGNNVVVARMSTEGVLDTSFRGVGYFTQSIGTNPQVTGLRCIVSGIISRVIKIVISGDLYNSSQFMAARFNSNGSADTSFGNSGVVLTSIPGSDTAQANGLAVQSGPLLVLTGTRSVASSCATDFVVARYNYSNGSLDTNFYGSGILVTNLGGRQAAANAVAIQPDGKIVLAGYAFNACGNNMLGLCRLNPDSTFDSSFGTGGKLLTSIRPQQGSSPASPVAIQPDGRIVVAGAAYDGQHDSVVVARFLASGALDSSFGTGGAVTNIIGTNGSSPNSIALQSDGKIVVAASASVGGNDIAILRFNTNGSPDTTWNGTGKSLSVIGSTADGMAALAVQSDGKIINAGGSTFPGAYKFSMLRCATNGALDNSFGSFGKVATSLPNETDAIGYGMTLQPDHKIILAGLAANAPAYQYQLALVRYNTNGTLDASFGTGGAAIASIGLANSYVYTVALQSDGKIVTACRAQNGPFYKFAVARFLTNGALDSNYGFGGVNYFDFATGADENVNGMALDSLGRMVIAGGAGNLFAVIRVTGDPVLRFNSITTLANHHLFLTGSGVPGASHTLLKAIQPSSGAFSSFAPVSTDASGNWQYEDTTVSGSSVGFYRLSYP
jgi:uncharacterized delta-60 repeat protein